MPGVDLVINALFETSGLRWDGDCGAALFVTTESRTKAMKKDLTGFTAVILLRSAECKSGKACVFECGSTPPLLASLLILFQFFEQLLFQMPARGLFDRAPLCGHGLFFRLAFFP